MASRNRKHSRNRYHEMESIMAKVLIGDAFLFFLYMYAANRIGGWVVVKGITAVLTILVSALGFNSVGGLTFAVAGVSINLSGLAIAAIVGILLNAILPGNDYEFDSADGADAPSSGNLQV